MDGRLGAPAAVVSGLQAGFSSERRQRDPGIGGFFRAFANPEPVLDAERLRRFEEAHPEFAAQFNAAIGEGNYRGALEAITPMYLQMQARGDADAPIVQRMAQTAYQGLAGTAEQPPETSARQAALTGLTPPGKIGPTIADLFNKRMQGFQHLGSTKGSLALGAEHGLPGAGEAFTRVTQAEADIKAAGRRPPAAVRGVVATIQGPEGPQQVLVDPTTGQRIAEIGAPAARPAAPPRERDPKLHLEALRRQKTALLGRLHEATKPYVTGSKYGISTYGTDDASLKAIQNELASLETEIANASGGQAAPPPATGGQPAPAAAPAAGKPLDRETAARYLEAAGGDAEAARARARADGYTF